MNPPYGDRDLTLQAAKQLLELFAQGLAEELPEGFPVVNLNEDPGLVQTALDLLQEILIDTQETLDDYQEETHE